MCHIELVTPCMCMYTIHAQTCPNFVCILCMHMHGVTGSMGRIVDHEHIEAYKKFCYVLFKHSRSVQSWPSIPPPPKPQYFPVCDSNFNTLLAY